MTLVRLRAVLARRWWVIPLSMAGVLLVLIFVDSATSSSSAVAEVVVVVPSGATTDDPGRATEAIDLASTYVRQIPEDRGVIDVVAATVGTSRDDAASRMSAFGDTGTSLVRLRYRGSGERQALLGARGMEAAVTGERPAAAGIEASFLRPVRPARIVDDPGTGVGGSTILVGLFLGLCLGVVLLLAWERVDPHVDSADDLIGAFDVPVTALAALTAASAGPLLGRWRELSAGGRNGAGGRVGLLAASTAGEALVEPIAVRLERLAADAGPELVPGPAPGGTGAAEAIARSSSTVVLVVAQGERLLDVRRAVRLLSEYGSYVAWLVLADPAVLRRAGTVDAARTAEAVAPARTA